MSIAQKGKGVALHINLMLLTGKILFHFLRKPREWEGWMPRYRALAIITVHGSLDAPFLRDLSLQDTCYSEDINNTPAWLMWFIAAFFEEITTRYCRAEEASVPEPEFYGSRINGVFAQEIYSLCQPQTGTKANQSHVAPFPANSAPHALFQFLFWSSHFASRHRKKVKSQNRQAVSIS